MELLTTSSCTDRVHGTDARMGDSRSHAAWAGVWSMISSAVPSYLLPKLGPFQLTSRGRVLAAEPGHDAFDRWGIDRTDALVSERPAMDVAHVPPTTIGRLE